MEQEIIDWANSFEATKTIDDLKTGNTYLSLGVALCQIVSRELFQDKKQCELKIRVINCTKQDYQSCIRNLTFALSLIEESQSVQVKHLTGQMLYQNPLKIFQILQQFYRQKSASSLSSKPPKAPQKQDDGLFYVDENLVQPNQQSQSNDELVANKYKMIKPNSPYQDQIQQRTQTHQTEYQENSNRSKPQNQTNDSINLTPKKIEASYNKKLKQELQFLENQIIKEQQTIKESKSKSLTNNIMQEERPLKCKITQDQKLQLIEWLKLIRLIKLNATGLEAKLPKICRNGVIFFDLLNRLSGREEVLKGALRNPKNAREIKHNHRRVLDYLKQFEKMNYRFLNSEQLLLDGDEDTFWGLLYDIRQFFGNPQTANTTVSQSVDSSQRQSQQNYFQQQQQQQQSLTFSQQKKQQKHSFVDTQLEITVEQPKKQQTANRSPTGSYSRMHNLRQEYDSVNRSLNSLMKKSNVGSQQGTPVNQSLQQSRNFSSSKAKGARSVSLGKNCVTREMEIFVQTYFKQKGLYENDKYYVRLFSLFSDPIRNGNQIMQLVDKSFQPLIFKSIIEVQINVDQSLQAVKAMVDAGTLPAWIKKINSSNIMQLDRLAMGLYWWLLKQQTNKLESNISSFTLPYKQDDIDQLKLVTLHFVREFDQTIQNFNDLVFQCQTGLILCKIEAEIFQQKIMAVYTKPVGEKQCLSNIRKALDVLKGKPLGQRFVWNEKSIYEGDQLIILGLFEDLRRYFDGLPQRQGDSYFEDGPYLSKCVVQKKGFVKIESQIQQEPYSLLQKSVPQPQIVNKKLIFDDPPQFEWLNQYGYKINWNNQILEEFKDGTILCHLIQKLESIEFKGVSQKPSTNAACLANVRKVFTILKEKFDMPLDLVIEQEKVVKGDKEYLTRLLNVIKNIYKHKIKSR